MPAESALAAATPAAARTSRKSNRHAFELWSERIMEVLIKTCGFSAILFVFAIFYFVFREAFPLFSKGVENEVTGEFHSFSFWDFLTSTRWQPTLGSKATYGVGAIVVGTLSVTVLAMAIAVPFGLGAAIFVSEFCKGKVREWLKVIIELLAAIPSIVWGFIGLGILNPLIQQTFDVSIGLNMLNGAILLALMSVPIMVSIGEDALKAVPDSFREAAMGLGATRWQQIYRVLLPAAKNGLLAAVLLGIGRAVGETMAVLMATGHSVRIPHSILDPVRTLTATIAAELGEASDGSPHYRVLFLIGVLLFTMTFIVNLTADLIVKGVRNK